QKSEPGEGIRKRSPALPTFELLPIFSDFPRGVVPGSTHHASPRVGAGTAQIEPANRCAILGPSGDGSQEEKWVHTHLTVEDVASRHSIFLFQVEGRQDVTMQHAAFESRRIFFNYVHHAVGVAFLDRMPVRGYL